MIFVLLFFHTGFSAGDCTPLTFAPRISYTARAHDTATCCFALPLTPVCTHGTAYTLFFFFPIRFVSVLALDLLATCERREPSQVSLSRVSTVLVASLCVSPVKAPEGPACDRSANNRYLIYSPTVTII